MIHDEGVVGIDDLEGRHPGDFFSAPRDNAAVLIAEEGVEKRDQALLPTTTVTTFVPSNPETRLRTWSDVKLLFPDPKIVRVYPPQPSVLPKAPP